MTHWSRLKRSAGVHRYSSWGALPPPALNWIASSGYSGSPVISARRLASVDFPPPALPNTATFLTRSFHYLMRSQQQRPGDGQLERPHGSALDHQLWRAKLFNGSSSSPGDTWPIALNNPWRSISARPAVSGSREQVLEQLAQLRRASERLAKRSEIALVDDQRHALEAAGVIVGAKADLVRALRFAVRELQQLDGRPVVGRLDLRFLFDDTAAPME